MMDRATHHPNGYKADADNKAIGCPYIGGGGKGLKEKELGARAEGGEKMPPSFKEILLAERPFPKKKAEPIPEKL